MNFNSLQVNYKRNLKFLLHAVCENFNSLQVNYKPMIDFDKEFNEFNFNSLQVNYKPEETEKGDGIGCIISIPYR